MVEREVRPDIAIYNGDMQENRNPTPDAGKRLWFKRKLYGWGWTPVTWQGWATVLAYIVILFAAGLTIDEASTPRDVAFTFALPIALSTVAMMRICYAKGERPRWQWGKDEGDPTP